MLLAWWIARAATRTADPLRRARLAAILPLLVITDLLSAHWVDVPTVDPRYWTVPPESAIQLKSDPSIIRVFGVGDKHSGEPGYASEFVDFKAVRDPLDWSLPLAWHLNSSRGNTPMISRRNVDFAAHALGSTRYDLEGDSYIVTGRRRVADFTRLPMVRSGTAVIHKNGNALPRARLIGKPVYAENQAEAIAALERIGGALRDRLVVEDPDRPMGIDSEVAGTGLDCRRDPRTRRGRNRRSDAGVSCSVRHVRPRLVGHRRRPASTDLARLRRVPRRLPSAGEAHGRVHLSSRGLRGWD